MMSALQNVYQHNKKELAKFRRYLRMMPKVVIYYAADFSLTRAMQPASRNFSWGTTSGKRMPHSSSNAAWNWRISFSGPQVALDAKDYSESVGGSGSSELRSTKLIGYAYEERSTYNIRAAYEVVSERRMRDIAGKLYSKLFTSLTSKAPNVMLYNAIPQGSMYAEHANLPAVQGELASYAMSGVQLSYTLLRTFMSSGIGSSPNPEGLEEVLKSLKSGSGKTV